MAKNANNAFGWETQYAIDTKIPEISGNAEREAERRIVSSTLPVAVDKATKAAAGQIPFSDSEAGLIIEAILKNKPMTGTPPVFNPSGTWDTQINMSTLQTSGLIPTPNPIVDSPSDFHANDAMLFVLLAKVSEKIAKTVADTAPEAAKLGYSDFATDYADYYETEMKAHGTGSSIDAAKRITTTQDLNQKIVAFKKKCGEMDKALTKSSHKADIETSADALSLAFADAADEQKKLKDGLKNNPNAATVDRDQAIKVLKCQFDFLTTSYGADKNPEMQAAIKLIIHQKIQENKTLWIADWQDFDKDDKALFGNELAEMADKSVFAKSLDVPQRATGLGAGGPQSQGTGNFISEHKGDAALAVFGLTAGGVAIAKAFKAPKTDENGEPVQKGRLSTILGGFLAAAAFAAIAARNGLMGDNLKSITTTGKTTGKSNSR